MCPVRQRGRNYYRVHSEVRAAKQVVLLMKAVPVAVFTDVQRSLVPQTLSNTSYDDVKATLVNLYSTKKSALGSSVQYFNCKQKPGQSIEECTLGNLIISPSSADLKRRSAFHAYNAMCF